MKSLRNDKQVIRIKATWISAYVRSKSTESWQSQVFLYNVDTVYCHCLCVRGGYTKRSTSVVRGHPAGADSLTVMWILEIEFRSLGFTASTFT